jgi:hypothetical protein
VRRLAIMAALAGCFDPVYPTGLTCSDLGTCPPGQACDSSHHCVALNGSGGAGGSGGGGVLGQCTPQASVCDPVCDSGCDSGHRCDISGTPNTGQCIANGSVAAGQTCSFQGTHDTCAAPMTCLDDHLCYRMCYTDDNCGNSCCAISVTVSGGQDSGFSVCVNVTQCDPTSSAQGPCRSLEGCYLQGCPNNTDLTECASAGNAATGASCQFNNTCTPGNKCIGNICRKVCRLSSPNCPSGTTCMPVMIDAATVSHIYGVCR